MAWDDPVFCQVVHPPLTALTRDVAAYGAHAARVLAQVAAGVAAGAGGVTGIATRAGPGFG